MNDIKIPPLEDKNDYSELLCQLFNIIDNVKSYAKFDIDSIEDELFLYSNSAETIVCFIPINNNEKNEIKKLVHLEKIISSTINKINQLKEITVKRLLFASTFGDNQALTDTINSNEQSFKIDYLSWQSLSNLIIKEKDLFKKFYNKFYNDKPEKLAKLNRLFIDGSGNIVAQDINNSILIINKNDTKTIENLFKANVDKLAELEILIRQNTESSTKEILFRILAQTTPKSYTAEREIYNQKLISLYSENIMNEKDITLKDVYVEPDFLLYQSCFDKDDDRLKFKNKSGFVYPEHSSKSIHNFIYEVLQGTNSLNLSKISNVIFVLGYPGQGKTSFCKRILFDLLTNEITNKEVFFFRLRDIDQIKQLIKNPIPLLLEEAQKVTEIKLDEIEFRKSIIILDGLDELYMKENLRLDEIDDFCRTLINEASKSTNINIIVTSRYHYIDIENFKNEKVLILQIKEFTYNQQLAWIKQYGAKKKYMEDWFVEELKKFNNDYNFSHIGELVGQPLLLYLISTINSEIDITANRTTIYTIIFNELVERQYDNGKLRAYKDIEKSDLRKLIQEIAFAIFSSRKEYINKSDLLKLDTIQFFIKKFPPEYHYSLKSILSTFYFQEVKKEQSNNETDESRSNYTIEFLHKSLQEYMIAERIYENVRDEFLATKGNSNYVIDNPNRAFEIVFEQFSKQLITIDIQNFLIQLIENDSNENRINLNDRLKSFFPEIIKHNFLLSYNTKDFQLSPFDLIKNTFIGFWSILYYTNPLENYLKDENLQKKFSLMLRLVLSEDFKNKEDSYEVESFNIPLNYQTIVEEFRMHYFVSSPENAERNRYFAYNYNSYSKLNDFQFDIVKTVDRLDIKLKDNSKYINAFIHDGSLESGTNISVTGGGLLVTNYNFDDNNIDISAISVIHNTNINQSQLKSFHNSKIINSNINETTIKSQSFINVDFITCSLSNVVFIDCIFNNVNFINCTINNSIFKSNKIYSISFMSCFFNSVAFKNDIFFGAIFSSNNFSDCLLKSCFFIDSIYTGNILNNTKSDGIVHNSGDTVIINDEFSELFNHKNNNDENTSD